MKSLIIALDVETEKEALSLVKATKKYVDIFKVGPGLFLRYGPPILKKIRNSGRKIFLDLKFHDIPSTMARSIKEAAKLGVYSATVHTSAGRTALKGIAGSRPKPLLWGVTVLTSLSEADLGEMGVHRSPLEQALRLCEMAQWSHLDGVVASVGEASELRKLLGPNFQIITPGIRLPNSDRGDQKRIATPQHARLTGVDFIVVGRPIFESRKPGEVAEEILRDWRRGAKAK